MSRYREREREREREGGRERTLQVDFPFDRLALRIPADSPSLSIFTLTFRSINEHSENLHDFQRHWNTSDGGVTVRSRLTFRSIEIGLIECSSLGNLLLCRTHYLREAILHIVTFYLGQS